MNTKGREFVVNRRQFFKWTGLGTLSALVGGGAWFFAGKVDNPYYSGPVSDHFNGKNFFNPEGSETRGFLDFLKWKFGSEQEKWPEKYPSPHDGKKPDRRVEGNRIKVTMIGHASVLIQTQGVNFLTDPVFVERASPVQFAGPKRVNPPGVRFEDLPKIDYVLLTHNHYDHMDLVTLKRLADEHGARIITPLGNDAIVLKHAPDANCMAGDWGDSFTIDNGLKVHFEPCHHWSARGIKDRRMALWAAFVIEAQDFRIFHVGDTGFHDGVNYQTLFEKHGAVDLAILPIGAYEPRWFMKPHHQNPDEAVRGHMTLHSKNSLGHHWGTFQLTNEAVDAPVKALAKAKEKHGIAEDAFVPLRPGEVWSKEL